MELSEYYLPQKSLNSNYSAHKTNILPNYLNLLRRKYFILR
jgi:hypothetical protein